MAAIVLGSRLLGVHETAPVPPRATGPSGPPTTPTPVPDCLYSVEPKAWVDANANGVREKEEPPLAGVEFHVTGGARATSDATGAFKQDAGHIVILAWRGCPGVDVELSARAPAGYEPTTPAVVRLQGEVTFGERAFGFRRASQ